MHNNIICLDIYIYFCIRKSLDNVIPYTFVKLITYKQNYFKTIVFIYIYIYIYEQYYDIWWDSLDKKGQEKKIWIQKSMASIKIRINWIKFSAFWNRH